MWSGLCQLHAARRPARIQRAFCQMRVQILGFLMTASSLRLSNAHGSCHTSSERVTMCSSYPEVFPMRVSVCYSLPAICMPSEPAQTSSMPHVGGRLGPPDVQHLACLSSVEAHTSCMPAHCIQARAPALVEFSYDGMFAICMLALPFIELTMATRIPSWPLRALISGFGQACRLHAEEAL